MKICDRIAKQIAPYIQGKRLLEVACGTAECAVAASRYAEHVTCTDICDSRLRYVGGAIPKVAFELSDVSKLTYGNGAFDAVAIYNSLWHIKDTVPDSLHECVRELKLHGYLIIIASWKLDRGIIPDIMPLSQFGDVRYQYYGDELDAYVIQKV